MYCVFFAITIIYTSTNATDYCNLESCKEKRTTHTMCKYPSPTPAAACGRVLNNELRYDEKYVIVKEHNDLRQKVASGREIRGKPGPQPKAVYMPNLTWDNELEVIAQRWADQCLFQHDKCRDVQEYAVGQNIGIRYSSAENNMSVKLIITSWYNEVVDFDSRQVSNFKSTEIAKVGHYTQFVWAKTTKIGCGQIKYKNTNNWYTHLLICNYGSAGNYIGELIYEIN